ncbi:MAG: hypothetical protein JXX28_16090 [Deltaproteobacteria bacterium]|nr:hypothetical protein [Deltaproteobacteria bacterium]
MSMYFDHARCPSCGAAFDPDRASTRDGKPACPYCGEPLKVVDFFGIADPFAEDEAEEMSLDDLVPGQFEQGPVPGGYQGRGNFADRFTQANNDRSQRSGSRNFRSVSKEQKEQSMRERGMTPAPTPSSGSLPVHVPREEDDAPQGGRSAMDIMRDLKKRR